MTTTCEKCKRYINPVEDRFNLIKEGYIKGTWRKVIIGKYHKKCYNLKIKKDMIK